MVSILMLLVVSIAVLAIFATTRRGSEIAKRVGLRDHIKGAASNEDLDFLLQACGGDVQEVARRVEYERERFSELTEADHYRRAIRRVLAEKRSDSDK